jgi:hypothetical protein
MFRKMSYFVRVRAIGSDARWLTIAEIENYQVANAMAQLVEAGIDGHPGGIAVGRIKERPAFHNQSDMTPAELDQAQSDLAGLDESNVKFAASLQAAAETQLSG